MSAAHLLRFANLLFAGILAGMEVAIHYGLHRPTTVLGDVAQVRLRQALVLRLRILVPAFFLPAAASGLAVAVMEGAAPGLWLRIAGILGGLVWIAIRVVGTVPINKATLIWNAEAPPADWRAQVDHAERFHILGVWAAVGAFVCFLASAALETAPH
jgi:hypothetical protein